MFILLVLYSESCLLKAPVFLDLLQNCGVRLRGMRHRSLGLISSAFLESINFDYHFHLLPMELYTDDTHQVSFCDVIQTALKYPHMILHSDTGHRQIIFFFLETNPYSMVLREFSDFSSLAKLKISGSVNIYHIWELSDNSLHHALPLGIWILAYFTFVR